MDISDRVHALAQDTHDEDVLGADRVEDDVTFVREAAVTRPDVLGPAAHFRVAAEQLQAMCQRRVIGFRLVYAKLDDGLLQDLLKISDCASESLIFKIVPRLYAPPNLLDRALGHATLFSRDERLDQDFTLVLIFLVATDEVTDIIARVTVMASSDLIFYPVLHEVGQGHIHGCHDGYLLPIRWHIMSIFVNLCSLPEHSHGSVHPGRTQSTKNSPLDLRYSQDRPPIQQSVPLGTILPLIQSRAIADDISRML